MHAKADMEKSWKAAIMRVLREANAPLHYSEISERILAAGYYATDGATPAATVNAQIAVSIKHDSERSPFLRVDKGIFTLRAATEDKSLSASHAASPAPDKQPASKPTRAATATTATTGSSESDNSIIQAFGMYWQRDLVVWRRDAKLLGKEQANSRAIDFGRQRGIYILYDHHTVVYVGRSIDRPVGQRLFEHTTDRLGSRWDRFSWFGLLEPTDEGGLREVPLNNGLSSIIATLEALLIEALEPPQNRKRGDDLTGMEYILALDPELQERQLQHTLRSIEQKLRGAS
jgi:hypothetical protein